MGLPYIKFYPGDFRRDTAHLSFDERAAYRELLDYQWAKGSVPDDDAQIARIIGVTLPRWLRLRSAVLDFFDRVEGKWVQARMDRDRIEALAKREKLVKAAKTSHSKTSLRNKRKPSANAEQKHLQSGVGVNTPKIDSDSQDRKESLNPCALDHEFAQIVTLYPRRTHRQEGRMAYYEARKVASFRDIVAGIDRLKADLPDDPQYIPSLPKWLLGERWNDEPASVIPKKKDRTQAVLDSLKERYHEPEQGAYSNVIDLPPCRKAE